LILASLGLLVKVVGQRSRSNSEKQIVYVLLFEPLGLGLPSSANDNCELPLPVYWNCLFVINQGAFNMLCINSLSALINT